MRLELEGIEADCIIGERIEERAHPQCLVVDVALEIGEEASMTDELADTVDYAHLAEEIRQVLADAKCKMIERAARLVAERCLVHSGVRRVAVRVKKSGAVAHLKSATAVFEVAAEASAKPTC